MTNRLKFWLLGLVPLLGWGGFALAVAWFLPQFVQDDYLRQRGLISRDQLARYKADIVDIVLSVTVERDKVDTVECDIERAVGDLV